MSELPSSLKARVLSQIREQPAPTRSRVQARFRLLALITLLMLTAVAVRKGTGIVVARPTAYNLTLLLSYGFALGRLLAPLSRFLVTPLGPSRGQLRARARQTLPVLALGVLVANAVAPSTWAGPIPQLRVHLPCIGLGALLGITITWLALRWLGGSDSVAPRATGRAVGAAAGSAAALAASLSCAMVDPVHMLAGHVLPVALVALCGGALAARFLPSRTDT